MNPHLGQGRRNEVSFRCIHPSDQPQLAGILKALQDRNDLIRSFVLTPDGLHHPEAASTLQIEPGIHHQPGKRSGNNSALQHQRERGFRRCRTAQCSVHNRVKLTLHQRPPHRS
jgi:hypothetical protein